MLDLGDIRQCQVPSLSAMSARKHLSKAAMAVKHLASGICVRVICVRSVFIVCLTHNAVAVEEMRLIPRQIPTACVTLSSAQPTSRTSNLVQRQIAGGKSSGRTLLRGSPTSIVICV